MIVAEVVVAVVAEVIVVLAEVMIVTRSSSRNGGMCCLRCESVCFEY